MTDIVTERLLLKPPQVDIKAIRAMVGWLNDPEVVRYSEQRHRHHTDATQLKYILSFSEPDKFREIYYQDELIGTITAIVDEPNSVAEVGILICKECWGTGLGYEAWKGFCDHLLCHGIRKIEAGCVGINYGMIHVFKKYGMMRDGRRYNHFLIGNELYDMLMFGKF